MSVMADEEGQQSSASRWSMSTMADEECPQVSKAEAIYQTIKKIVVQEDTKPQRSHSSHPSIFRVPHHFRSSNPSAFTPRRVSIGPIHKADGHLQQMEEHKKICLHALLTRAAEASQMDREKIMRQCVDLVLPTVGQIRSCYGEAASLVSDDLEWVTMMVIDGCFILELLYTFRDAGAILEGDPLFNRGAVLLEVKSDLVLVENQIPFFVLQELFSITLAHLDPSISLDFLLYFILEACVIAFDPPLPTPEADSEQHYDHILGFLQDLCYQPTEKSLPTGENLTWYSASELDAVGMKFEANKNSCDVTLVTTPICSLPVGSDGPRVKAQLRLPAMYIHLNFEIFLRNLTAYEMFSRTSHPYVISYVILMNRLMKTARDVELLERSKVITSDFSSPDDVRILFMKLSGDVVTYNFLYDDLVCQLDYHCNQFWPRLRLSLAQGMTKTGANILIMTSWKGAAVIGALVLFVLTVIQTVYTIRGA